MDKDSNRYSITRDGRLLDSAPMEDDKPPLVFDKGLGKWMPFEGTMGEWRHATAITAEEAARLTGNAPVYRAQNPLNEQSGIEPEDGPPVPPFTVDLVDQFSGGDEDGYGTIGRFDTLEAAIAEARRITEDAIRECGGYQKWDGMGDAGLVYDATGKLVWDGVKIAEAEHKQKSQSP